MSERTAKLIRRTAKAFMAAIPGFTDFKPVPRQLIPVESTAREKLMLAGLLPNGKVRYVIVKTVTFVNHPQSERGLIRRMKRRARVAQQRSFA